MNKGLCKRILKSNLLDEDKIDLIKLIGIFEAKKFNFTEEKHYTENNDDYSNEDEKIDQHLMNKIAAEEAISQFDSQIDGLSETLKDKKSSKLYNSDKKILRENVKEDIIQLLVKALDKRITNPELEEVTEEDDDIKIKVFNINDTGFNLILSSK